MALTDKNILITPNIGSSSDPKITFSGADSSTSARNITLNMYPTNGGTLSFEGSVGQLFSVTNSMSGTIYSVNDVSGMPSIQVQDTGNIFVNPYSGSLLVGTTSGTGKLTVYNNAGASGTLNINSAGSGFATGAQTENFHGDLLFYYSDSAGYNAAAATLKIVKIAATGRSINASGTINASGADYAEYMVKCGDFIINKGDICGINANGQLTNVFSDAISFAVKSTNPSYVGGDTWGSKSTEKDSEEYTEEELEIERQKVDRIAFAGQVPVNVLNAIPGQYIIPVNDNGAIKGEAVSNPTFEQYQIAVGKVIAVEDDGRARIIVKVF